MLLRLVLLAAAGAAEQPAQQVSCMESHYTPQVLRQALAAAWLGAVLLWQHHGTCKHMKLPCTALPECITAAALAMYCASTTRGSAALDAGMQLCR
jgi:hypothetical protein